MARLFALKSRIGVLNAAPNRIGGRNSRKTRSGGSSTVGASGISGEDETERESAEHQQDRVGDVDPAGDVRQRDGDREDEQDQLDDGLRRASGQVGVVSVRGFGAGDQAGPDAARAARQASRPVTSSEGRSSAGSKPNTWPRNDNSASSDRRIGRRAPESVTFALEEQVGMRDAVRVECGHDRLGLAGRHDPVVGALQDEDGARDPVQRVDRRALAIEVGPLGIRADHAVEVARLELVRLGGEQLEIADAVRA